MGKLTPVVKSSLDDLFRSGLGIVSWNGDPNLQTAANTAPTSQTIYAVGVPYRTGQVVTNIGWDVGVAASGTTPTGIFCGIANATTVVMDSANLASSSAWTTLGLRAVALSSAYTIPTDGLYYHLFLQNGTFSVTNVSLARSAGSSGQPNATGFFYALGGTGQTALPAVNAAITLTAAGAPLKFASYST